VQRFSVDVCANEPTLLENVEQVNNYEMLGTCIWGLVRK